MTALTRRALAALADTWDREAESLGVRADLLEAGQLPVALTMRGRARQLAECAAQLRAAIARPDVCGCGHPAVLHAIRADKTRGACSAHEGPKGVPCGCRRYQQREEET